MHTSTADVPVFVVVVAASNYFAGNRYVLKGDTAVMLLFDSNGKIAGIQNGVRDTSWPLLFLCCPFIFTTFFPRISLIMLFYPVPDNVYR